VEKDKEKFQEQIDKLLASSDGSDKTTEPEINLSLIIPAYNERWRLPSTLIEALDYLNSRNYSYEIIIVDDGSKDDTCDLVDRFSRIHKQIKLIRLAKNRGKGHAVQSGVLNSHGNLVLFADADGSTPFSEMERLEHEINIGADIAIGSRAMLSEDTEVQTRWYRKFLGRVFNWTVNFLLLPQVADTQCGFKMFKKEVAHFLFSRQESEKFAFDIEILYIARKCNLKVVEVAINWHHAPGSKVNLLIDSSQMLMDVFRIKVRHSNLTPAEFEKVTDEMRYSHGKNNKYN